MPVPAFMEGCWLGLVHQPLVREFASFGSSSWSGGSTGWRGGEGEEGKGGRGGRGGEEGGGERGGRGGGGEGGVVRRGEGARGTKVLTKKRTWEGGGGVAARRGVSAKESQGSKRPEARSPMAN